MASIISAGTTSGTALNMTADTSGQLQLATGASATTAVTIDTSQNVGIGNTIPSSFDSTGNKLVIGTGSGNQGISIYAGTTAYSSINFANGTSGSSIYNGQITYYHSANALIFGTNGSAERMRIDSSGNVGIGTSNPSNYGSGLTVTNRIMPQATPSTNWGIDFATDTGGNNYITLAASATYDLATGGGLILISNNTVGDAALFLTYNGNTNKISGGTTIISGTGGSSQIGVTWNSGAGKYRINNGYGTSQSLWVGTIRIRQSN